jgi:hypothetical protein
MAHAGQNVSSYKANQTHLLETSLCLQAYNEYL